MQNELEELLRKEHSIRNTMAIVNYVGDDADKMKVLMSFVCGNNKLLVQRATWPLGYIVIEHPHLVLPHLDTLMAGLTKAPHPAYKRNVLKFLREMDNIPEQYHSSIINHCFNIVLQKNDPAAVIAFAIIILGNFYRIYPEIGGEILAAIEPLQHHELPSIKNSSIRLMKHIHKTT